MNATRLAAIVALTIACFAAAPGGSSLHAQTAIDNPSGLPVPRFVSLRSDEVNLRTGPGLNYPIDWVYKRKGLPVEVIDEFDTWRQIRDFEGTEGWVHQSMIDGQRTFLIVSDEQPILFTPEDGEKSAARLQRGVVGDIQECGETGWCLVSVKGYRGWIRREDFFGALEGEVFE
jgi:SH3-like domain-containing protein